MPTLQAIIFDFDGVIANTEPLHFAGLHRTLNEIGIELTEAEYYAEYLGYDDRGWKVSGAVVGGAWRVQGKVNGRGKHRVPKQCISPPATHDPPLTRRGTHAPDRSAGRLRPPPRS